MFDRHVQVAGERGTPVCILGRTHLTSFKDEIKYDVMETGEETFNYLPTFTLSCRHNIGLVAVARRRDSPPISA